MVLHKIAITLAALGMCASFANAQENNTTQTSSMASPSPSRMNVNDPVGWFPFIGLSGGYMSPNDTLLTEGTPTEFRLMGSYFAPSRRSVLDLGLGVMGDTFSQKSTVQNNFISGGVAELAWRYNFTNRWQLGPIADAYYTGDVNRFASSDPNWTSFAGLQLIKEIPIRGESMFRVGLKALTDVSIPTEDVSTVMLDLQWGFGGNNRGPEITAMDDGNLMDEPVAVADATTTTPVDPANTDVGVTYGGGDSRRVIETDSDAGTLTVRADERMQFASGAASLEESNREFVQTVGAAIAERPDLFDRVEVVGFADQTGSDDINMRISKQRAQSVASLLRESGLDSTKITSSWKGASEPLYQSLLPEDLQQNRRVDIIFHGVKDQAALEDLLNSVL